MLTHQALHEVITLSEASELAARWRHPIDRGNLLRYAQSGRLTARKSKGTWLTTRHALRRLIEELEEEPRGRPRIISPPSAVIAFNTDDELNDILVQVRRLQAELQDQSLSPEQESTLWDELTAEAVYYTNRIEGNRLTWEEARQVIEEARRHAQPVEG